MVASLTLPCGRPPSPLPVKIEMMCGIPGVILDGTMGDWLLLTHKVDDLAQEPVLAGLRWWFIALQPILQQLLATYMGAPDEAFWARTITSTPYGTGQTLLSGWICSLIPFTADGGLRDPLTAPIDLQALPCGAPALPLALVDDEGRTAQSLELRAGFIGWHVDGVRGSIAPRVGWAINPSAAATEEQLVDRLQRAIQDVSQGGMLDADFLLHAMLGSTPASPSSAGAP